MSTRSRARRSIAFIAGIVSIASVAATPAPTATVEAMAKLPIAGEVTITAPAGLSGITLAIPGVEGGRPRLDNTLSTVDVEYNGEFALVQMVVPRYNDGVCLPETFCSYHEFAVAPGFDRPEAVAEHHGILPHINGCETELADGSRLPCRLPTPTLDVYVASDAPLTFTIRFPELAGAVHHTATGTVNGVYERVQPTDCPTGDCERFAIGHSSRTLGTPDAHASVIGFAYARAPQKFIGPVHASEFSTIGVDACVYPGLFAPGISSDPDDHPAGCDVLVSESNDEPVLNTRFVQRHVLTLGDEARGVIDRNYDLDGAEPVYFGFSARNETLLPDEEGFHGAWAVWLEQGIYAP